MNFAPRDTDQDYLTQLGARVWAARKNRRMSRQVLSCLFYTADAADDPPCVNPGGRRLIKTKTSKQRQDKHTQ